MAPNIHVRRDCPDGHSRAGPVTRGVGYASSSRASDANSASSWMRSLAPSVMR
jgi:hypothetical protein